MSESISFVNQGSFSNRSYNQSGFFSQSAGANRNCEFCTAAGVGNLVRGHAAFTSRDAANFHGLPDTYPEVYGTDLQAERIKKFGKHATGRSIGWTGITELPYSTLEAFMCGNPSGTVFAVYVSGPLVGEKNNRSHWLNAIVDNAELTFFDFQTNRDPKTTNPTPCFGFVFKGGGNPSSCKGPFVGIITQGHEHVTPQDMHSSDPQRQVGMLDTSRTKGIVIAFLPASKR